MRPWAVPSLLPLLLAGAAWAQTPDSLAARPDQEPGDSPTVRAAPLTGTIKIDGHLDEAAWQAAEPFTAFTQLDPNEGQPASEKTEVRFLIGDDALFIGARMYDGDAKKIRARLVRRDEDLDGDFFVVFLDSYHDHLTSWLFRVNPAGSVNDAAVAPSGNQDTSWDGVWHVHTSIDAEGWTAEYELPLSQLHYATGGDGVWGLQLRRWIYRKQELDELAFVPKKEMYSTARFGHLTGLQGLRAPRHFEVLPFVRTRSEFRHVAADDPFRDGADQFSATGLDLKYGVTSNLTLNTTVNPDFGEVEADPAVVNLSAFETFFPERRPFFVEGAEIFQFGNTSSFNNFNTTIPFHARRIGRPPQRVLGGPDVMHVDVPERTTITTAAKLTGKTRNGWTIGVLDALTPLERGSYSDTLAVEHRAAVEPLTNYFVGRFRRDLRKGNTVVGGMLTAVNRDLADPALQTLLRREAYVGGVDFTHYWAGRRWSLDGNVITSTIRGDESVIARAQRSSARYYQRPDATHLTYDPTRTDLSGAAGLLSLNKTGGKHWRGSLTYQDWSPGFEINDVGFQNAADSRGISSLVMYTQNTPARFYRNFTLFTFSNLSWNYGGDLTYSGHAVHAEGLLSNYWSGYIRSNWYPGSYDDRLTRGGPLAKYPAGGNVELRLDSDARKSLTYGAKFLTAWDVAGGWIRSVNGDLSIRPASSLRITLEPGIKWNRDQAQYVTAESDPLATDTYGARYVFAQIDQTTLNLDARVDWTFSPKLSLQYYMQPLVVSGDYRDFKELRAARTYDFDVYGKDRGTVTPVSGGRDVDPDGAGPAPSFFVSDQNFNFRSLIGNAVLRWEYRPGSTLFVVWQQNREATAPEGDFDFSRDVKGIFRAGPENVLAVKLTYWLGL